MLKNFLRRKMRFSRSLYIGGNSKNGRFSTPLSLVWVWEGGTLFGAIHRNGLDHLGHTSRVSGK